ncbi:mannitol dehydrogenase family protein [Actinomycetospora callitridis]|uniref:mannitol dehydrogenase family protein n=1 Tax=Actinomycetospora callitridis TaxID=913944 RepID=UPI002365EB87|nr:mannitol dehydrogenase family protein [Actinomycetospora callitridis]MDD7921432.1 mannitol dehydrogenase family protein [Actinomycetospora callitridis]
MAATTLTAATLADLPADVPGPTYDRGAVSVGIVHFGVGGFHRAHQAMYLDQLMQQGKALDWGICGVGVLESDKRMAEVTEAQDDLYTLVLKHADGRREAQVIGSIVDYLYAPEDPDAVLERMTDPATRIVSLTVTEGGYHKSASTGEFDDRDPAIQADIAAEPGTPPRTTFGYIVEALRRRRDDGTGPFTVMSCDNIQGNGHVAHAMITAYARRKDPELADWIEGNVPFPNSMVDRITPRTTDSDREELEAATGIVDAWPVVCEPFTQWVLEDRFAAGRPPFEDVGVQVVDDVEPYELMKLRLLNASHQAIAYLGYLAGYRYAHEVAGDELFAGFTRAYMDREATPTLAPVPGVDLDDYKATLIERFANPEIRDTLARLAAESSDRIPTWLVPVIRINLQNSQGGQHGELERSALIVAAWARYAEGVDEQGEPIEVVDTGRAEDRIAAARRYPDEPLAFLADRDLFGDLIDDERFTSAYRAHLDALHERGARATVTELEGRLPR